MLAIFLSIPIQPSVVLHVPRVSARGPCHYPDRPSGCDHGGTEVRKYCRGRDHASLSVIVPAHNEATVLPKCLEALLSQKTSDVMRVIVVDNGSTDHTADLASFWASRFESAGHEMLVLRLEQANNVQR